MNFVHSSHTNYFFVAPRHPGSAEKEKGGLMYRKRSDSGGSSLGNSRENITVNLFVFLKDNLHFDLISIVLLLLYKS